MVINVEIREYPKDVRLQPNDLTATGLREAIYECEQLIITLKEYLEHEED